MTTPRKATCKNLQTSADYQRDWTRKRRQRVIEYLGGKCAKCDWDDPRALQIDHIDGNGIEERRSDNGSVSKLHGRILAGEPGYQLLCANHNWIKRVENNEEGGWPK